MKRSPVNYLTKSTQPLRNSIYNMNYKPITRIPTQSFGTCWFYASMIFLTHSPEIQYYIKQSILRYIENMNRQEVKTFKTPPNGCIRTTKTNVLRYFYHIINSQVITNKNLESGILYTLFRNKPMIEEGVKTGQLPKVINDILKKSDLVYSNGSSKLTETILYSYNYGDEKVRSIQGFKKNANLIKISFKDNTHHIVCGLINGKTKYIFDSNFSHRIGVNNFSIREIISKMQPYYKDIVDAYILADSFIKK